MTAPHVMILGCGRSGTSIFGELFDALATYRYVSEPPFDEVLSADFDRPQAFKVPRESDAHPAPPGLSFPIERMLFEQPEMRFFWIVRHPLDAVASLKVGIRNDWGHHPRPPDWRAWLERPLVERCAHHWSYLNTFGFAQVEALAHVVTFEAMIADPLAFATEVLRGLDLDIDAERERVAVWAKRVQNTNNEHFVEAQTSRSYSTRDHRVRVGRWRENLSAAEVERITPLVSDPARRFGYRLDEGGSS